MNRRFLMILMALIAALIIPAGLVYALHAAAEPDGRVLASSISPALDQQSSQTGIASNLALTGTVPVTATATRTATVAPAFTATATSSPAPTGIASATRTPTIAPTRASATASPSATATAILSATETPTLTPTLVAASALTVTRSFRFAGTAETRGNGNLQASETFEGEKVGDDYHYSTTYRDAEGTTNKVEYVLAGGKLYLRVSSIVGGQLIGSPLQEAEWSEGDASQPGILPKDLLEAFGKAASTSPHASEGKNSDLEVDFKGGGRFSSGTAHADRATGRLARIEARQEVAVAPSLGMVISATMSLSDYDAPLSVSAPAILPSVDITGTNTISGTIP